jgi:hypothetical protein
VTKEHAFDLANKPLKAIYITLGVLPDDSFGITCFKPAEYDELYLDWQSPRICTYEGNGKTHTSAMCFIEE